MSRMVSRPLAVAYAALVLASLVVSPAARSISAQSPNPLVGTWTVTYERGRRVENGEVTRVMGEGRLQLQASGDSLVATLAAGARPDGSVPPPATFGGRVAGDSAVFTQKQSVRINMNGEESTRDVVLTWVLRASGDSLSGTLAREMAAMPEAPEPSPVTGKRVK